MWATRKLSTMNISRRFYNTASTYTYTLVKPSNRVNSLFVFKPYLFRGNFLWKDEFFKTSSRRFSWKENCNKELPNTGKESEGDDCVTSGKVNDFDIEQIDRLINRLDVIVNNTIVSVTDTISDEHLDYLSKIAGGNKNALETLKVCYCILKRSTEKLNIPFDIEFYDWSTMSSIKDTGVKIRVLTQQLRKFIHKQKKPKKANLPLSFLTVDVTEYDPYCYHLFHNSHFLRIYDSNINHKERSRGVTSMLFSPVIIYDCSYEKYMNMIELCYIGKQFGILLANNLKSKLPLHIVLCNFNESLHLYKVLKKYVPNIHDGTVPITMTDKSYLDLYPRNDLVYLSPHAKEMTEWDPNKTYIVGAFVDKYQQMQISIYKARDEGITCRKFPIDSYVKWERGSKCLDLVAVHNIVNEMFISNDWNKAFGMLPKRHFIKTTGGKKKYVTGNVKRTVLSTSKSFNQKN